MPITIHIVDDRLAAWLCQDFKPTLAPIMVLRARSSGKMHAWNIDPDARRSK